MKFFLHETRVLKTQDLCGIFTFAKQVFRTRVSKTRDATFLYYFKRCLTNYIQPLYTTILHIPPEDLSDVEFREYFSDAESSGTILVDEASCSSLSEGSDCPFILPEE